MQLYKWKSDYLKNYRPGMVVVMAENIDRIKPPRRPNGQGQGNNSCRFRQQFINRY
jgi:hypothetical protein